MTQQMLLLSEWVASSLKEWGVDVPVDLDMSPSDLSQILLRVRTLEIHLQYLEIAIEDVILAKKQDFVPARCKHVLPQGVLHCLRQGHAGVRSDLGEEIWTRRWGLNGAVPETLDSIGVKLGITRECVRASCCQIVCRAELYLKQAKRDWQDFLKIVERANQSIVVLTAAHKRVCLRLTKSQRPRP